MLKEVFRNFVYLIEKSTYFLDLLIPCSTFLSTTLHFSIPYDLVSVKDTRNHQIIVLNSPESHRDVGAPALLRYY